MEFLDLASTVDEAVCIIPIVIRVIAFPLSLVLKYVVSDPAGEDADHIVFVMAQLRPYVAGARRDAWKPGEREVLGPVARWRVATGSEHLRAGNISLADISTAFT